MVIKDISELPGSYPQLVSLFHSAFGERLEQGLHFSGSYITEEQLRDDGLSILVALGDNDQIVGCLTYIIACNYRHVKYGVFKICAILPDCKHSGIGSQLYSCCFQIMKEGGCQYVISSTAESAQSSVMFHIKNGFRIVGYNSYKETNYYSYVFRKQLRSPSIWNCSIVCRIRFIIFFLLVRLTLKENGSCTSLGKLFMTR